MPFSRTCRKQKYPRWQWHHLLSILSRRHQGKWDISITHRKLWNGISFSRAAVSTQLELTSTSAFFLTGLNLYLFTTSFYFCSWCPTFCFSLTYYGAFSHSCYRRVKVNFPVRKLGQKTRRPPCLGILIKQSCSFSDRYSFWTFFHPLCPHIAFSFFLWAPSGWVLLGHSNPTEASWYHLGHNIILFPYCSLLLPTPIWVYFLSYEEDTKELSD